MPRENYTKPQPLPLKREEKKLNYFSMWNPLLVWHFFSSILFRFQSYARLNGVHQQHTHEKKRSNSFADGGFKSFPALSPVIDIFENVAKKKIFFFLRLLSFDLMMWFSKIASQIHMRSKANERMTTSLTIIIIQRERHSVMVLLLTRIPICINVFIWENNMRSWKMKLHVLSKEKDRAEKEIE